MKRIISAILCVAIALALSVSAAATAALPAVFTRNDAIELRPDSNAGADSYVAVRLTPMIYAAAQADLTDLRIRDSAGEDVPYFVRSTATVATYGTYAYAMTLVDAFVKDGDSYFDYVAEPLNGNTDIVANALRFETSSTNFAKNIEVFGSYDGISWTFVQSDTLYDVEAAVKRDIILAAERKFTHYRVMVADNAEKIAFDYVELSYNHEGVMMEQFIEELAPQFSVETIGKQTIVSVFGVKNLRIESVGLETQSLFKREVSDGFYSSAQLYNLEFDGVSYSDTTLKTYGRQSVSRGDAISLAIENNDDKPIDIDGIILRYYADEIVFKAEPGETYELYFHADENAPAPVYDIASYAEAILRGTVGTATLGAIKTGEAAPAAPAPRDYMVVFNIVIVAVAVLLGTVILLRLKRKA